MRDGIYKNAPVTAPWRSLIRACQNDAAWEEEGPVRAMQALLKELRNGHLRSDRLEQLFQALRQPQGVLFGGGDMLRARLSEWSKECTSRERQVFEQLCRISDQGAQPGPEHLRDAVENVLRGEPRSHLRAIDGYLAENFPRERPEMLRRMKEAISSIPYRQLAEELSTGKQPKLPKLNNKPLDVDDDDLL